MKKFKRDNKNLVYLCRVSDIGEGKSRVFCISKDRGPKKDIAVFNIYGNFYAISNVCAHKCGPLNKGRLEKT